MFSESMSKDDGLVALNDAYNVTNYTIMLMDNMYDYTMNTLNLYFSTADAYQTELSKLTIALDLSS